MEKIKVAFLGSGLFACEVFKRLYAADNVDIVALVSQPDRAVGRKKIMTPTPFKQLALDKGFAVMAAHNSDTLLAFLTDINFDFLIVTDYGVLLSEDVLKLPKIDCLNVHASLLPKYRGASPIQAALLNGDVETGVSVMSVVKKLDAGPVYAYSKLSIQSEDDYMTLLKRLGDLGGSLLVDTLSKIVLEDAKASDQDESKVTFCGKINKMSGLVKFKDETAEQIIDKYRAYSLWPKVFFEYSHKKFEISHMELSDKSLTPEQILVNDGYLYIGCKTGSIKISKIKPESKNVMSVDDFLRGNQYFFDQIS